MSLFSSQAVGSKTLASTVTGLAVRPSEHVMPQFVAPTSTALSTVITNRVLSPSDDGFDELESGFGAFPHVKLDGSNVFCINGQSMGTEFQANIFKVRKVYLWLDREAVVTSSARFAWSYDNLITTREESLKELVASWRQEGYEPIMRKYAEAMAEILDGVWAGQLVCLSISPQSVSRLFAYREVLQHQQRRRIPEVITRVSIGEPVKSRGISFSPWAFEFVREVEQSQ